MLLGGFLLPVEAVKVLASEWNIYGFFLGLMVISALAEQAGIFEALAGQTARLAKGSSRRLFLGVFLTGTLTTAFLSNDATALILTPAVYAWLRACACRPTLYVCMHLYRGYGLVLAAGQQPDQHSDPQ
jgi:arsenical pump membrane protein